VLTLLPGVGRPDWPDPPTGTPRTPPARLPGRAAGSAPRPPSGAVAGPTPNHLKD
jgi:hypothetical protein